MEGEAAERAREEARLLPQGDAAWAAEPEPVAVIELVDREKPAPLWAWILLVFSVLAFTSSGVIFSMMPEVPSLTLASWRLQATSVLLIPACALELAFWTPADVRLRILHSMGLLAVNGAFLGLHFGLWVLSLQLTSLPHAMLFITMSPVFVALASWARGRPISRGELAGTALGVAGGALLALTSVHHGGGSERDPSWQGDACALAGAGLFVLHLEMGRRLRGFTPMLTYSAVVTSIAAGLLVVGAVALEGSGLLGDRRGHASFGVLQWLVDRRYIGMILMLAVVPGIVGHVGFNTIVKHIDSLVLTLASSVEPLLGSCIGYALGLVSAPPLLTYVGGFTVIASTIIVPIAGHARQQRAERLERLAAGKSQNAMRTVELA